MRTDKNIQVHAHIIFIIFSFLSLKISLTLEIPTNLKTRAIIVLSKLDLITISPSRKRIFNQQSPVIHFPTFNLFSVQ